MKEVVLLNKRVGETPLECMERFRTDHLEYLGVKMTYAGRLDPMASGLLVVLAGEGVHKKDGYLGLPKTYQATVVLGISTDTYDGLGLPKAISISHDQFKVGLPLVRGSVSDGFEETRGYGKAEGVLLSFIGTFQQAYPPYSSKTINGIQMHELARDGKLESVTVPHKTVSVTDITNVSISNLSLKDIVSDLTDRIGAVNGDFRQTETITAWQGLSASHTDVLLTTITFEISVSGGTYIRGIADELGKKLHTGAFLWKLHRTTVGEWNIDNI